MLDKQRKPTVRVINVAEFKEAYNGKENKHWNAPDVGMEIEREFEKEFGEHKQKTSNRKMLLTGLTDDCGISGVKHVFGKSILISRRVMWLLILTAATSILIYQVSEMFTRYTSHPMNVNVDLNYVSELTFPAVAVCNFNAMRKSETDASNLTGLLSAMHGTYNPNFDDYNITGSDTEEWYAHMAHQKDETILYHTWQATPMGLDTFQTIDTDFGVCYAFNTGNDSYGIRTVENSGKSYGLSMYLDTQQSEYNIGLEKGVGFQIVLYEQGDVPLASDLGFAVSVGEETRVGIELTNITNLPPPHGICGSRTLKYYTKYTKNACQFECWTDYAVSICGCRMFYMPGTTRICNLKTSYECILFRAAYYFVSNGTDCDCPVPCQRVIYKADLSHAKFPSTVFSEFMTAYMNIPPLEDSIVKVDIFFQELSIEEIKQQKSYDVFGLLCDIGGSLGLWLGGSILTLIEIIDICLKGCFNRLWH
ncbi:acid-sensing ion channel 2-like [Glandiceps talaboti]